MEAITFFMETIFQHQLVGDGFIVDILTNASTLTTGVICTQTLNVYMRKMALWLLKMRKDALRNTGGRV